MSPIAIRVWHWRPFDSHLYVGPWAIRLIEPGYTRFSNGSRWHSDWHRWREDMPPAGWGGFLG